MYPLTFLYTRQLLIHSNATTALLYIYIYIDIQKIRLPSQQGIMRPHHCMQMLLPFWFFFLSPYTLWNPPPPPLPVDNMVPSTPGHLCKLCFTVWRLQRKACVCWGGQISAHQPRCLRSTWWPWGQKVEVLSRCSTRDTNESTAAYCRHTPKRQGSKLPCQELWPQGTI